MHELLNQLLARRSEINHLPFAFRNFADLKQIAFLISYVKEVCNG